MTDTINDKTPKSLWDSPEPDKDFNKTVTESKVSAASAIYKSSARKTKNILDVLIRQEKVMQQLLKNVSLLRCQLKGDQLIF